MTDRGAGDLIIGIGVSAAGTREELERLLERTLGEAERTRQDIAAIATIAMRSNHAAVVALAAELGVPVLTYDVEELAKVAVPTPSLRVLARSGTPSVAEAAALLAASATTLLVTKRTSAHGAIAIAVRAVTA